MYMSCDRLLPSAIWSATICAAPATPAALLGGSQNPSSDLYSLGSHGDLLRLPGFLNPGGRPSALKIASQIFSINRVNILIDVSTIFVDGSRI